MNMFYIVKKTNLTNVKTLRATVVYL